MTQRNSLEHLKLPNHVIGSPPKKEFESYGYNYPTHFSLYKSKLNHFDEDNFSSVERKIIFRKSQKTVDIKAIIEYPEMKRNEVLIAETVMLMICKHPNIVALLGVCNEDHHHCLVIEHSSNGLLDDNLTHLRILTWVQRLKICLDVARGLRYLHYEMEDQKMIINGSIKSGTIALDENWGAKIVCFRNSVLLSPNQDDDNVHLRKVDEKTVYIDPEYEKNQKLTTKSDVYSFGVLMFEVLCGRLADDPIYINESDRGLAYVAQRCLHEETLVEMIDPIIKEGSLDHKFMLSKGPNTKSLETFIKVAYECLAETQDQRPTMKMVVEELKKALYFQENNKDDPRISLEDVIEATQNFHVDNFIGKGGFGNVYRGKIPKGDGFDPIVAKRLDKTGGQGEKQFRNELHILFKYKHENVIRLVGYCDENNEKVIVYEYASRESLDRYLNKAHLTWMKRLNICIDVATALEFLHGGHATQPAVIHRDIKTENILLTDKWKAKLADYGLSLISAINQETDYTIGRACGTKGYVDPLYRDSGFLTMESDIYSFGVVLFEILCGRSTHSFYKQKGQYLHTIIKQRFEEEKLHEVVFEDIKEQIVPNALSAFQTIAYRCLNDVRENRPTAKEVLKQLKQTLNLQENESIVGASR